MKKLSAIFMVLVLLFSFAACDFAGTGTTQVEEASGYSVAMITDGGDIIDKSYNQALYEASHAFADEYNCGFSYYKPAEASVSAYTDSLNAAASDGYNIIVCGGSSFAQALASVASNFPSTQFIVCDVTKEDLSAAGFTSVPSNMFCSSYQCELSGFMAGYAAAKMGFSHLAYVCSGSSNSEVLYGEGFVQGVDAAAADIKAMAQEGETIENIIVEYVEFTSTYSDENISAFLGTLAKEKGVQVAFCGSYKLLNMLCENATETGIKIIGSDIDYTSYINDKAGSKTSITNAVKNVKLTISTVLKSIVDGSWENDWAGRVALLGLVSGDDTSLNYVQLPEASSLWLAGFGVEDYQNLVSDIYDGTILVDGSGQKYAPADIKLNRYTKK